jgi:hypothetical protein
MTPCIPFAVNEMFAIPTDERRFLTAALSIDAISITGRDIEAVSFKSTLYCPYPATTFF